MNNHHTHTFQFDTYRAVGICEGFVEPDGPDEINAAWQYLIDTGLAWELQGWFGREAAALIEEGICSPPRRQS